MDLHPITLGILSGGNPDDVRTWSGVPYFIVNELRQRFARVEYVPAPVPPDYEWTRKLNVLSRRVLKRGFLPWSTLRIARRNARSIERHLAQNPVDVLLAITVDYQVAFLETDLPIVHHSDTTFAAIEGYYPFFSDLWGWAARAGNRICSQTLARSVASVYPSQWAIDSAVNDYGASPSRLHLIPYGANLKEPPLRERVIQSDRRQRCQLLFIGIDWERKGGVQAYGTMLRLRERGIDTNLVVIGCTPPPSVDRTHVTIHGFLNKQKPDELALYNSLWLESSFLCMPSRAETFGAVFAEAAAYGLPVISSRTGGIPSAVVDGETGILLPLQSTGEQFAEQVALIWETPGRYEQMVAASRDRYETTLNWGAWADAVTAILIEAAAARVADHSQQISQRIV